MHLYQTCCLSSAWDICLLRTRNFALRGDAYSRKLISGSGEAMLEKLKVDSRALGVVMLVVVDGFTYLTPNYGINRINCRYASMVIGTLHRVLKYFAVFLFQATFCPDLSYIEVL